MYQLMAACMAACVIVTFYAPEPVLVKGAPTTLTEAFILPLRDYIEREGAWLALAFILLYKIGDTMASAMTTPFYLELGYSKTEIGAVVKLFGFWATLFGGTIGGILIMRIGMRRALWAFGLGQMLSTLGFVALAYIGHDNLALAAVIAIEKFTGGLGTAAFVGFMGALTNRRFTATQYALLSSLMGVPRVLLSAPTGWLALTMGWPAFFALCTVIAIPGLMLIRAVTKLSDVPPAHAEAQPGPK
jgi:PAT family beta-lactamase induction signal transducer AmpG